MYKLHWFSHKNSLKLKVVLKWRDVYIENIRVASPMTTLKRLKLKLFINGGVLNHRDNYISHFLAVLPCQLP